MSGMNKKDGKLDRNGVLWGIRVVVKDVVAFDEFYEAIKDEWRDAQLLSKPIWMVVLKVSKIEI